ncbi:MAG TPA: CDP-diacylglycerol--serine O-phosphatidyltransferase [Melioribacteraceae bacterium]|nr:CDP-diacylglycerol--serine O-phosphatidyltransferase [Melioribacteraceae bacterium]
MIQIKFSKAIIPNSFTAMNIICGFFSIVYASQGSFTIAAIFIIVASIFDALDGMIARFFKTSSSFGVELDSLSDVVSFGAAPAFLIYKSYLHNFEFWGIVLSSFVLVFGAFRLARFNTQLEDIETKHDFKGLPIPVQAITLSSFIISFSKNGTIQPPFHLLIIPLILLLSFLMVSKIKYDALPKMKNKSLKGKIIYLSILVIGLILLVLTGGNILFYMFISLVLFGILRSLYYFIIEKI